MKKAITLFAGVCAFVVVYLLAFVFVASVFHAEHWSFVVAFMPALIAGGAVIWGCEE